MDWLMLVKLVAGSTLGGLVILWLVGGYYHLKYYVRRSHEPETWKCQPKRFLRDGQQREAMLLSSGNMLIGGLITGTFIYAMLHGVEIPIYFEVAEYGWPYTIGATLLLFVLVDAMAYYTHRALHNRTMFRLFHRWHHRFLAPAPFVVVAMHPVEFTMLQLATFVPLCVLPVHFASAIVVFVYIFVFNIIDHSGVKLTSSLPWQGPSTYHDDHHVFFHCNFGQHLTLWDRMHGTLRRENRRYGKDVFGGKGAPVDGDGSNSFIKY